MAIISASIVPTITTADAAEFQQHLANFQAFASRIQIDLSDGTFASTQLLSLNDMQITDGSKIDLHIMSAKPSEYLAKVLEIKPSLCIVHAEVSDNLAEMASQLKNSGIKFGLALLKGTFPRRAEQLITMADHVMVFAGKLGEQGGAADFLQIQKVPLIRAIKPDVEIGWDGGANLSNVRALAHADINVINVGNAISRASDPAAMFQSLTAELEKKGVLV